MAEKTKSLAVKYRPKTFDDVTEQAYTIQILQNQLESGDVKNAYLFTGAAGTGKTTCARIFANEINKGQGNPIELDAASNNSVDDVREIIQMAQTRSMDSEYKIFIIDECHMITTAGWNAMLKLIEEPPLKSIFIFCTTDAQKIPKTILSRVQRYNFKRISQKGIFDRLQYILDVEFVDLRTENFGYAKDAVEYIAKLSDGCLREAVTNLEKCLAFSDNWLNLENVIKALGNQNYDTFKGITDALLDDDKSAIIDYVNQVYSDGTDMKLFIRQYMDFVLDITKYFITDDFKYTSLPPTDEMQNWISGLGAEVYSILDMLVAMQSAIKWDTNPKSYIEARFLMFGGEK